MRGLLRGSGCVDGDKAAQLNYNALRDAGIVMIID